MDQLCSCCSDTRHCVYHYDSNMKFERKNANGTKSEGKIRERNSAALESVSSNYVSIQYWPALLRRDRPPRVLCWLVWSREGQASSSLSSSRGLGTFYETLEAYQGLVRYAT